VDRGADVLEIPNLRRLAGKHVVGPDGERIGKVSDVYESTSAGGGTFATVATGLFGSSSSSSRSTGLSWTATRSGSRTARTSSSRRRGSTTTRS